MKNSIAQLRFTTAQKKNSVGTFWGVGIQDIFIGDRLKHGDQIFYVEDVELRPEKTENGIKVGARIRVADATLCIWDDVQNAPQWFNEDANIEWL